MGLIGPGATILSILADAVKKPTLRRLCPACGGRRRAERRGAYAVVSELIPVIVVTVLSVVRLAAVVIRWRAARNARCGGTAIHIHVEVEGTREDGRR
jgi:hypothetical protein